jgi:uncharacterized protein (DUF1330 family)
MENLKDPEALRAYRPLVQPSLDGHQAVWRVRAGKSETLEGATPQAVVVLEFPSLEAARAWYDSPAYREASVQRHKAGDFRVMLVEGVA